MSKKSPHPGAPENATAAPENLTALYTAHLVHTLAQMLFQQLASGRASCAPWMPAGAAVYGAHPGLHMGGMAAVAAPFAQHPGYMQGGAPALIYWYP